jgi:glycosyltransferase 2 family protein
MLLLRFVVPVAVLGYLLTVVPLRDTLASLKAIPLWAFASSIAVAIIGLYLAALRWRLLFSACGVSEQPSTFRLLVLHLVGLFYNVFVPGGLGGDVVRAVAVRRVMGARGLPGALAIILLERTLGLAGLLILVAATFTFFPLTQIEDVVLWSAVGLGVAAAAVGSIVNASRIARFLPAPLARVAAALPTVQAPRPFALALALSVFTQSALIFIGHVMIATLADVRFTDSMVVMPLIGAAQYFPFSVGGAGVRELAFVKLYALVGVVEHHALAASLAVAVVTYIVAAAGGILQMFDSLGAPRR